MERKGSEVTFGGVWNVINCGVQREWNIVVCSMKE